MVNLSKSELQCQICGKILKDPVHLPCYCTICHDHLTDGSAKDGYIACETCGEKFEVKSMHSKVNRHAKCILDIEGHLNQEEKAAKIEIQNLIMQFQQLYGQIQQEQTIFEVSSYDHFAEIKRRIDLQREELKEKVDEIYLAIIRKVELHEEIYKQKLDETRCFKEFNVDQETNNLEDEFRKVDLTIQNVQQLQSKFKANIKTLQDSMDTLKFMGKQMNKCAFESNTNFDKSSFGVLNLCNLNRILVSCSSDKTVKVWDLDTNKCILTLQDHADSVQCITALPNKQHVVSGSNDKTLKVWDVTSGECLQTLTGHTDDVECLKILPKNRVASGSNEVIKVWDLTDGKCLQTLLGHTFWVLCFLHLPDGTLISGSQDKTIKFWNLDANLCIKTLNGHTGYVNCLLLLKDGRLASGSEDMTIKIWNMVNGECIHTLEGHTRCVWKLEFSYAYDLISFSNDKTFRIWNVTSGKCIRILNGHGGLGDSQMYSNILAACSSHKKIEFWDLESRKCTVTLEDHQDTITGLVFI